MRGHPNSPSPNIWSTTSSFFVFVCRRDASSHLSSRSDDDDCAVDRDRSVCCGGSKQPTLFLRVLQVRWVGRSATATLPNNTKKFFLLPEILMHLLLSTTFAVIAYSFFFFTFTFSLTSSSLIPPWTVDDDDDGRDWLSSVIPRTLIPCTRCSSSPTLPSAQNLLPNQPSQQYLPCSTRSVEAC